MTHNDILKLIFDVLKNNDITISDGSVFNQMSSIAFLDFLLEMEYILNIDGNLLDIQKLKGSAEELAAYFQAVIKGETNV